MGWTFKEAVNALLEQGLLARSERRATPPFIVQARPLGVRPGLDYDDVGDLLERLDGPSAR